MRACDRTLILVPPLSWDDLVTKERAFHPQDDSSHLALYAADGNPFVTSDLDMDGLRLSPKSACPHVVGTSACARNFERSMEPNEAR